jgi:hypothetical protein
MLSLETRHPGGIFLKKPSKIVFDCPVDQCYTNCLNVHVIQ